MISLEKLNNDGFTLIETIVAVGIIAMGFVAVLVLITTSVFYISNIQNRLIAANLAAEGIEVVRNIRDNNWLQNKAWNSDLTDGNYQVAYNSAPPLASYNSGSFLLLDSNTGFYSYIPGGVSTPYIRKISITHIPGSDYEIQVISTVIWQIRNITYTSSAEDHLFNWK